MSLVQIEEKLSEIIKNKEYENFIYDFLLAYDIPKSFVTRIKKGDYNLSKDENTVLVKKKIYFKEYDSAELLSVIEDVSKNENITRHNPRFAIVTDYKSLVAKDLKLGKNLDIKFKDLPKYYDFFLPLAGAEVYNASNDNEADRNAAYKMGELYDILVEINDIDFTDEKKVHGLNIFLSRLLFCFFAEDTGIFEENIFTNTLVQHTNPDGSDTHNFLDRLFEKLNTESKDKFPNYIAELPYVNGGLFGTKIPSPKFNAKSLKTLKSLGDLDWQNINPDIFGSMIQAVVRNLDDDNTKHYTSVPNILKVIKPLFLDKLEEELEKSKDNIKSLRKLIKRISNIKFFDPACGSGNFLIIAYKEIRLLEIKILQRIIELSPNPEIEWTSIQLNQFYGIELDDFAHEIAILSLWLAEHQMNMVFEDMLFDFGKSKPILPLKKAGKIVRGNAALIDWKEVCPSIKTNEVYVLGNPPFDGSRKQSQLQKEDMKYVFKKDYKSLDYVTIWFYKGARYITENNAKCAFVSTNSICQGLLVSLLWGRIINDKIEIDFAYTSFKWTNNAKGNAGVTVIIVGLRNVSKNSKFLFQESLKREVSNINPYLLDAPNLIVTSKTKSISNLPKINHGNMPADGGMFLFSTKEKEDFIKKEPKSEKWFRKLISAKEHLNGRERWCLWLENITNNQLNELKEVNRIVEKIRVIRANSSRPKLAEIPHLFAQITQPSDKDLIIIPRVSSENRDYLPVDLIDGSSHKVTDSFFMIPTNQPYVFGIVSSKMHMVWTESVGGKFETRIQYSKTLCYNTFPFPEISIKQKETLNQYVFDILDERAKYTGKTIAQIYDPNKMPKGLKEAHKALDKAVEQCYRLQPFNSDTERLEYLFKMYETMIKKDTLFAKQKKTRKKKVKK